MGYQFNPFTGSFDAVDSPDGVFNSLEVNGGIDLNNSGTYTTTTGIYSPGADQVAISTSGARRLYIDSAGALTVDTGDAYIYGVRVGRGAGAFANNTVVGSGALTSNTTGYTNTANGSNSLYFNTIGFSNTANGSSALQSNISGIQNTAAGFQALLSNTTGSNNIGIGVNAGLSLTTGSNNTIIGAIAGTAGLSNTVIIGAGNTERLRIDSNGRVGIGTSSPRGGLDAIGTCYLGSTAAGGRAVIINEDIGGAMQIASSSASYGLALNSEYGAGYIKFRINSADKMHLDASGRVGIGTTSPQQKFNVSNGGAEGLEIAPGVSSNLNIYYDYNRSGSAYCTHQTQALDFRFRTGVSPQEAVRIDSSGRLLVGTSSSRQIGLERGLQVESTGASGSISITRNDNASATTAPVVVLGRSRGTTIGSNTIVQNNDALGYLLFAGSNGSDMNSYGAWISCEVDGTPGANDMPGRLVFSTTADGASSPTERMKINAAGNLYSVPTYNNAQPLSANVFIYSDGSFGRATSSIKYKKDVETLEDEYADAILNCRPVWYRAINGIEAENWGYWGLIAEEVAEIDPRLVHWKTVETSYDEKGAVVTTPCDPEPEGVQYDRFVPHLLNLIKRQKEQIEAQDTAIAALETRLSALEAS